MTRRSPKQKKLRSRLVMVNLSVVLSIVLLFSMVMLSSFFRQLQESAADNMLDKSYNSQLYAMRYFAQLPDREGAAYLQKLAPYFASYMADAAGLDVEIYSRTGMLASSTRQNEPEFVSQDVWDAFDQKSYMFVLRNDGVVLSFSSPIYMADGETVGVIRYLYPMTDQYRQLWSMAAILGGLSAAALVITLVVGFLFTREITRPLYILRDMVNNMQEGNLSRRIPPMDNAEMDELGSAFNIMSERMDEYITVLGNQQRQLRQFFNNATHQLKTPLTSIIGYSQMIQLNSDSDQVCEDAFIIEEAGETLLHSIEAVLEESRSQTMWYPMEISTFSLRNMVEESAGLLRPRLSRYRIALDNRVEEALELRTDRSLAQEVVLALLDNAILHSGCDKIRLWCTDSADGAKLLHITDNGNGIDEEDAPYIFKAFYRGPNSAASGNGLGLSVCDSIMRRIGGAIRLRQGDEGGAEFILEFPEFPVGKGDEI